MAVSININIQGDANLKKMFRRVQKGARDYTVPMKQSGIYMERSIQRRFKQNDWKALSPATIKIHPHRAGGKPLLDTGKLRASVTSRAVKNVSKQRLEYGTNLIYAPLHNFGGKGGWGKTIPQREFLYFSKENERRIKKIFEDYFKELSN